MLMVLVVVPFTMFYYEGEDNDDDENAATSKYLPLSQIIGSANWICN
jgi:hypothetical protein